MNYKSMILITLLLPAFCYSQTKEDRIKELEDRQFEKVLEIRKMGKKITLSHEFIDHLRDNVHRQIAYACHRASKSSDADEEQIKENILKRGNVLANHLDEALWGKGAFDYDLTQELFSNELDGLNEIDDFETFKFFNLQAAIERLLLKHFVSSYQERLDELCAIGQELATLKQER